MPPETARSEYAAVLEATEFALTLDDEAERSNQAKAIAERLQERAFAQLRGCRSGSRSARPGYRTTKPSSSSWSTASKSPLLNLIAFVPTRS